MDNTSFSFLENVSCSADEKILEKYSIYESKLGNVGNSIVAIYLFCIGKNLKNVLVYFLKFLIVYIAFCIILYFNFY